MCASSIKHNRVGSTAVVTITSTSRQCRHHRHDHHQSCMHCTYMHHTHVGDVNKCTEVHAIIYTRIIHIGCRRANIIPM